jgi:hypothetical protein
LLFRPQVVELEWELPPADQRMPFDVFISYSKKNKDVAEAALVALEAERVPCWIAPRDIAPAANWAESIVTAIDNCKLVILIYSSAANQSRHIPQELQTAFDVDVPILPVRIEDVKPSGALAYYIPSTQWVDTLEPSRDYRLKEVAELVKARLRPGSTNGGHPNVATGVFDRKPYTSLKEIKEFLEEEAKIKVTAPIARGKLCDVYAGQYGQRKVAIKAFDNSSFPQSIRDKLLAEVELSSQLTHPSFLRISNIFFPEHLCLVVSDHVDGAKTIAKCINAKGTGAFSVEQISDILSQVCGAVIEAENLGLKFLCITPSQIFVKNLGVEAGSSSEGDARIEGSGRQRSASCIARLSPINFGIFKWNVGYGPLWSEETVPFVAPEFAESPRWFKERMLRKLGKSMTDDELDALKLRKSHQFAVGMLAWTMLKGAPVYRPEASTADPESRAYAEHQKENFLDVSKEFSADVAATSWETARPGAHYTADGRIRSGGPLVEPESGLPAD